MRELTTRRDRTLMVLTAVLVILIGLLVPRYVSAANCPTYPIKVDNPEGEGNQGELVGQLTLCPAMRKVAGSVTLRDTSDDIDELDGWYRNPEVNGSFDKVIAQTVGMTDGQYWVELRQDGATPLRCFLYTPGERWWELQVPEGQYSFHCYELGSEYVAEQSEEPLNP